MPAGQIAGIISDLPSAGDVVRRLKAETADAYADLADRANGFTSQNEVLS